MRDDQPGTDPFEPPLDETFRERLMQAITGEIPVYGVVLELDKVNIRRAHPDFHPENSEQGMQIVQAMAQAWNQGQPAQPWLYVDGDDYVVADNYFWMALIEQGKPNMFPAQVMGEPLEEGLVDKVSIPLETLHQMLGLSEPEGGASGQER